MDRLCKLSDGNYWYQIKRSKAKRVGPASANFAVVLYNISFFEVIWPKILNCEIGLVDRIQIIYGQCDSISLDETAQYADNLKQLPIKNLNHLFKRIYTASYH